MDIRKISIGPNYKSDAMHYIVGQEVLGGKYFIHLIQYVERSDSVKNLDTKRGRDTTLERV
jgi:hypothetical protein